MNDAAALTNSSQSSAINVVPKPFDSGMGSAPFGIESFYFIVAKLIRELSESIYAALISKT
jgi:hypothetical protein